MGSSVRVGSASGGASLAASRPPSHEAQPGVRAPAAAALPALLSTQIRVRSTPRRVAASSTFLAPSDAEGGQEVGGAVRGGGQVGEAEAPGVAAVGPTGTRVLIHRSGAGPAGSRAPVR